MTLYKFHTEGPQILGDKVKNSVAKANWRPGFVHHCIRVFENNALMIMSVARKDKVTSQWQKS
jgi:hypothetical protein